MTKKNDIDKYIDKFPKGAQDKLIQVREIIKSTVTEAEETISYGMPTFKLNGTYLIYFAGQSPDFVKPLAVTGKHRERQKL